MTDPASTLVPGVLFQPTLLTTVAAAALVVLLVAAAAVLGWRLVRRSGPADEPAADGSRGPSPDLDDDEQFVVDLLREHDGQLPQSRIVDASDWSKSKVSRLLSRMEGEGYVEKIAVGRRNLVVLDVSERSD